MVINPRRVKIHLIRWTSIKNHQSYNFSEKIMNHRNNALRSTLAVLTERFIEFKKKELDDYTRDLRRGEDDIPDIPALPLGDNMKNSFHDWLYDELKDEIEWDTIVTILDRYSQTLIEDYKEKAKR